MKLTLRLFLLLSLAVTAQAEDLNSKTLAGEWMFTHIILEGQVERPVNRRMRFLTDGQVINYDAGGQERNPARYKIERAKIIYTDESGVQTWQVLEFDGATLRVDHMGAEMFFQRIE